MAITKRSLNNFTMIMNGVIGGILWIVTMNSFTHLNKSCTDKALRDILTFILVLGVFMFTISICYALCQKYGGSCYVEDESSGSLSEMYISIMSGVSILILILSIVMLTRYAKHKDVCKSTKLHYNIWFILVLSIFLVGFSSASLYYIIGVIPGHFKKTKKSKAQDTTIQPPPNIFGGGGFKGMF